jgi:hypothetical protein
MIQMDAKFEAAIIVAVIPSTTGAVFSGRLLVTLTQ